MEKGGGRVKPSGGTFWSLGLLEIGVDILLEVLYSLLDLERVFPKQQPDSESFPGFFSREHSL
jgi:hypothetical protein